MCEFKVWKTVTLGVGPRTGEGLLRQILAEGYDRDAGNASACLKRHHFIPHPRIEEVDLVALEMHQVGYFPGGRQANDLTARTIELDGIYRWANYVGLETCPMEVGPQLRLAYKDQPMGEQVLVAMEPVALGPVADQIFVVWHGFGWDSARQSRTLVTKALDLTHATPFRYWSESSCLPGCERLPGMPEMEGGRSDTWRLMVFVKPRN